MDFWKDHPLGEFIAYNKRKKELRAQQKSLGCFIGFIIIMWLAVLIIGICCLIFSNKLALERLGQLGDFSGLLNTLFSGLALFYLIYSINLQREDLRLTLEDMKLQTVAQTKSQKALEEQNNISIRQKNYDDIRKHIEEIQSLLNKKWLNESHASAVTVGYQLFYTYKYLMDGTYKSDNPIFKNEDFTNALRLVHFKLTSIVILLQKKQMLSEDKCVLLLELTIVLHDFLSVHWEDDKNEWAKRDLPLISEETLWSIMQHFNYIGETYKATMKENGRW